MIIDNLITMDKQELIQQTADELLGKMGVVVKSQVTLAGDMYTIQIDSSDEASLLIGKYGNTLRALQTVLEVILFKKLGEKVEIMVNVGDYRERQKERVEGIAESVAQRVIRENQPASLDSFTSFERKLIHEYISAHYPDLRSFSEGEGPERKLIVSTKETS